MPLSVASEVVRAANRPCFTNPPGRHKGGVRRVDSRRRMELLRWPWPPRTCQRYIAKAEILRLAVSGDA